MGVETTLPPSLQMLHSDCCAFIVPSVERPPPQDLLALTALEGLALLC